MPGRPDPERAKRIYDLILANPGISKSKLMKLLGYKAMNGADSVLASCGNAGYLLCEDRGKLTVYRKEDAE